MPSRVASTASRTTVLSLATLLPLALPTSTHAAWGDIDFTASSGVNVYLKGAGKPAAHADGTSDIFDGTVITDGNTATSAPECADWCLAQIPRSDARGFSWNDFPSDPANKVCRCWQADVNNPEQDIEEGDDSNANAALYCFGCEDGTDAPSSSAGPTAAPTIAVEVPGTLTFAPADCDATVADDEEAAVRSALEDAACDGANEQIASCAVEILSIECAEGVRRLMRPAASRRLQTGALEVVYKVIVEAICSLAECHGNADGVEAVAQTVYDSIAGDVNAAISGFVSTLSPSVAAILAGSTASNEFDPVIVPALEFLSDYYPDWQGGSGTCLNDNQAPMYMKLTGVYFEKTLEACCRRFYGWDVAACTGTDGALASFYPSWETADVKCLDAADGAPPEYVTNNPGAYLIDDVEDCCEQFYHWDLDACLVESGATAAASLYSGGWYVSYEDDKCVRDCAEATSDPTCAGKNKPWETLYDSPADCCEGTLWWNEAATCEAESTGGTAASTTGSGEWYVDWSGERCVRDCIEDARDPDCGGLAKRWDPLYGNANTCCDRLSGWTTRDDCTH